MGIRISTRARIGAAAAVLLAAGVTTTFAGFTDWGAVESDVASGTLDLRFDTTHDGNPDPYVIEFGSGFDNLMPGATVERVLNLSNAGSIPATVAMALEAIQTTGNAGTALLEDYLTLTILHDDTDAVIMSETPLADVEFDDLDIGTTATAPVPLRLIITMDPDATLDVAGQAVGFKLRFTATQPQP